MSEAVGLVNKHTMQQLSSVSDTTAWFAGNEFLWNKKLKAPYIPDQHGCAEKPDNWEEICPTIEKYLKDRDGQVVRYDISEATLTVKTFYYSEYGIADEVDIDTPLDSLCKQGWSIPTNKEVETHIINVEMRKRREAKNLSKDELDWMNKTK